MCVSVHVCMFAQGGYCGSTSVNGDSECMYIQTSSSAIIDNSVIHAYIHAYKTHTCMHNNQNRQMYIHIYIYTCMHTYIDTYMQTYIPEYIQVLCLVASPDGTSVFSGSADK